MSELSLGAYDSLKAENERLWKRVDALNKTANFRRNIAIEWKIARDKAEAKVFEMQSDFDDAMRYRWLKDNDYLDAWGVLKIGECKVINIDNIIDEEIKKQAK